VGNGVGLFVGTLVGLSVGYFKGKDKETAQQKMILKNMKKDPVRKYQNIDDGHSQAYFLGIHKFHDVVNSDLTLDAVNKSQVDCL
jgi:hypothetical protein